MRPSNLSKRRALGASGSKGPRVTRHFGRYWPVGGAVNVAVRSARSEWPLTALRPRCRASRRRSLDRTHSRRSGLSVRTGLDAPLRHCQDETATAQSAPRPRLMISLSEILALPILGRRSTRLRLARLRRLKLHRPAPLPSLRRKRGVCLLFSLPAGAISPRFIVALTAANLFASPGTFDPSRVDPATERAYRSWRRRPPSCRG